MLPFDVRNFSDSKRESIANKVRKMDDFRLPELKYWNYSLCRKHVNGWEEKYYDPESGTDKTRIVRSRPKPQCRQCGIHFRKHQRVSIAWLYLKKRALLADTPGSGKTTSAAGLIALLAETGELGLWRKNGAVGRVIIVPRAPALGQWKMELERMIPSLNVVIADGTAVQRKKKYLSPWTVLLVSPQTLLNDVRADLLTKFPLAALITDDVDTLRNPGNRTAVTIKKVGRQADRMVIMTGTPLQKKLPELHSVLDPIGGLEVLGDVDSFIRRHVTTEYVKEYDSRTGRVTSLKQVTAYQGLAEVKEKIAPLYMRRTAADLDDVNIPAIVPEDIYLDLYPLQRAKYDELKKGVLQIIREEGSETKHLTALSKLAYGAQICGGLASLGEEDGPHTSVKMDWIMENLGEDGAFEDEKVVLFASYKNSVRALQRRFQVAGIGFETIWGETPNKAARLASQERFWEDPNCRVLIGTQSIEQSLNLQIARHLINMDMILNPARMEQLAGRIAREGSAYKHVYVHNLLTVDTQEEKYIDLLEREAALAGHIWDDNSQLFQQLSPIMMLRLITG